VQYSSAGQGRQLSSRWVKPWTLRNVVSTTRHKTPCDRRHAEAPAKILTRWLGHGRGW